MKDYPPLPKGVRETIELHQPTDCTEWVVTGSHYTAEQMRAYVDADRDAQQARKPIPMSKGQREQVARRAEAAMNGDINLSWRDALMSETEAFHGIKETP